LFEFEKLRPKQIFGSEEEIGRTISKELKVGVLVHAHEVSLIPVQIRWAGWTK